VSRKFLVLLSYCLCGLPGYGQHLLVDRGSIGAAKMVEALEKNNFLADRFTVGASGEVWVIDRLRVWGKFGSGKLENATLFGGLENTEPALLECECHNLTPLRRNAKAIQQSDSTWQLEFDGLNWSVPGATAIQFGIAAPRWATLTVSTSTQRQIRTFDAKGKFLGLYGEKTNLGFALQAWGHLPAKIEIEPAGESWSVKLVEPKSIDPSSFRFGPGGAAPVTVQSKDGGFVLTFRAAETTIGPADVNACLKGQRQDGAPFEGCDLLKRRPH